jgi:DNA-binding SARP family transcriptional activator
VDPNDVSRGGPAGLHLRLLGRFELYQGTSPRHVSPSGERLLAYLGIRSEPVRRGTAAAELWPACTDTRAAANLRSAVWRLPGHDQGGLIAASPQHLALNARVSVDLHDLTRQVGSGSAAGRPGPDVDVDVDVDVLRQDVLPEWPEEWLIGTREWFRQIRLHALEALCDRYRDDGRLDAALDAGITAVAADPLRESAHRRLTPGAHRGRELRRGAAPVRRIPEAAAHRARAASVAALPQARRTAARPAPGREPRRGAAVPERLTAADRMAARWLTCCLHELAAAGKRGLPVSGDWPVLLVRKAE